MGSDQEPESSAPPLKGKVYFTEDRCKGCSFCVAFCPTDTLAMGGRLNHKGYHLPEVVHPENCTGCDMCGLYCPDFAIFGVRLNRKNKKDDKWVTRQ